MNSVTDHYIQQHQAVAGNLPGQQVEWVNAHRSAGLARFEEVGFPTQRDEDWRYTALRPITGKLFNEGVGSAHPDLEIAAFEVPGLACHRLVFVDGIYTPQLSTQQAMIKGITVESLATVLEQSPETIRQAMGSIPPMSDHGFNALNNAFSRDGVVVIVERDVAPELPLEILCISHLENAFAQPRNLIVAGDRSHVSIIERYVSAGDHNTFTNSTTELLLGNDAEVDYYLVQNQSNAACQVSGIRAKQSAGSRFSCRTITLGGALVRNDLSTELNGELAHCDMLGLYNASGRQHIDNYTTVVHNAERCTSREIYKGVLDQRSRAVFHGRIKVQPGAQKTDAAQSNHNLLLSRDAEIDTKPQLEIYADDVKCSHGATIGQINNDSLFYLRSRGLDESAARSLLTFAFVNDVIDEIGIDELKSTLEQVLAERLIDNEQVTG